MSEQKSEVLETLGDILNAMAAFAGGSIPADNTTQYDQWIRWVQLAQWDAVRRGFWARLLTSTTVNITAGDDEIELPDDFCKRNGIYVLNVGEEDWASNGNSSKQRIMVTKDPVTAKWICKCIGYTPTETTTGTLWYFFNPPVPTETGDLIYLDGEMIMFGALKEYFRQSRQAGSQDDARIEYENRLMENLNLENLPTPQELMGWTNVYQHNGISPMSEFHWSSSKRDRR